LFNHHGKFVAAHSDKRSRCSLAFNLLWERRKRIMISNAMNSI
jgi:hypothetical protein